MLIVYGNLQNSVAFSYWGIIYVKHQHKAKVVVNLQQNLYSFDQRRWLCAWMKLEMLGAFADARQKIVCKSRRETLAIVGVAFIIL